MLRAATGDSVPVVVFSSHSAIVLVVRLLPATSTVADPDSGKSVRRSTFPIAPSWRNWSREPFMSKTPTPPPEVALLSAMTRLLQGLVGFTQMAVSSATSPEPEKLAFSRSGVTVGRAGGVFGGAVVVGGAVGAGTEVTTSCGG